MLGLDDIFDTTTEIKKEQIDIIPEGFFAQVAKMFNINGARYKTREERIKLLNIILKDRLGYYILNEDNKYFTRSIIPGFEKLDIVKFVKTEKWFHGKQWRDWLQISLDKNY